MTMSAIAIDIGVGLVPRVRVAIRRHHVRYRHIGIATVGPHPLIAKRLSARQLILHRISAGVCVCVTLRNANLLRACACRGRPFCCSLLTC